MVLAVVLAAADCVLCSTRPDRSGDLDDHSLIPGWEEAGFDSCVGEVYYANKRRPGRTTFQRPEVSPWKRLGRTQWACHLCSATVCYSCSPVVVYPTTGHTPAEYLAASYGDDTNRQLRQLARDFGAADMVVGGRLGAVDHCGRPIFHAPVDRLDVVELVWQRTPAGASRRTPPRATVTSTAESRLGLALVVRRARRTPQPMLPPRRATVSVGVAPTPLSG